MEHKNGFSELIINDYMDAFLLEQQKEKDQYGEVKYYTGELPTRTLITTLNSL